MSAMLEFRSGGRRVSQSEFLENIKNEAIEAGLKQLEQQVHAAAAGVCTENSNPDVMMVKPAEDWV
jgi:hypothetical protein